MKFYYNDKLIRTSKTHHYTHAIINIANNNSCYMCSATKEGCEREKRRLINHEYSNIEYDKAAIKALEAGKSGIWSKISGRSYFHKFDESDTIEYYTNWIASHEAMIDHYRNHLIIVEIEERN